MLQNYGMPALLLKLEPNIQAKQRHLFCGRLLWSETRVWWEGRTDDFGRLLFRNLLSHNRRRFDDCLTDDRRCMVVCLPDNLDPDKKITA